MQNLKEQKMMISWGAKSRIGHISEQALHLFWCDDCHWCSPWWCVVFLCHTNKNNVWKEQPINMLFKVANFSMFVHLVSMKDGESQISITIAMAAAILSEVFHHCSEGKKDEVLVLYNHQPTRCWGTLKKSFWSDLRLQYWFCVWRVVWVLVCVKFKCVFGTVYSQFSLVCWKMGDKSLHTLEWMDIEEHRRGRVCFQRT